MSIVSIKKLIHEYLRHDDEGEVKERFRAVDDVSLDVEKGEFIAILGHNGSGKSTLAKHINALLFPSAGLVLVNNNDTRDEDRLLEIRKSAGMVFQNPDNQIIATIVEEDVAFGPENIGIPTEELRKRVDESLAAVRMQEYAGAHPGKLSGGQKQRIAIAGVLAMRPECIILDEPTAMLDPIGRKEVMEAVTRLNREEGMTVILVTHHMDEVIGADRLFVMNEGKIALSGKPREVFMQVAKMRELGLDVPQVTELAYELSLKGCQLGSVLNVREFVDGFVSALSKKGKAYSKALENPKQNLKQNSEKNTEQDPLEKSSNDDKTAILELENASFTYAPGTTFEKTAVDNISLKIKKGEFIALIGHTGSGKSTFISMLNALEKPTSGRVLFEGNDINAEDYDRKALRGKVGLVFQYPDHQLFEETIYKDVAFGPSNLGIKGEELDKCVREALELVGISESHYDDSPMEISGGQKKRVCIAGVLAMKPDVLILDEPTAGLDPAGRDEILGKIRKIHRETGCTVILVSHSMEAVAEYAERIIVLNKGRLVYDDVPHKVFEHYTELEKIGLMAPQVSYLMHALNEKGIPVRTDCIKLGDALCELEKVLI